MEFKERLKKARTEAGMSIAELGRQIGINPSMISNWEAGRFIPRDKETVIKAADALKVDYKWLLYNATPDIDKQEDVPQVTMSEEVKKEEPAPVLKKDPTFLIYKAEDGRRLDSINLCIRHIREMNISQAEKIQIHKTLNFYREAIERTILFGE